MNLKSIVLGLGLVAASASSHASVTLTYEVIGQAGEAFQPQQVTPAWKTIEVEPDQVDETVRRLEQDVTVGAVEVAQPVYPITPIRQNTAFSQSNTPDAKATEFNDPQYQHQNIWRSPDTYPGAHNIELAMQVFDNSRRMKLGVIDGGFVQTRDITYRRGVDMVFGSRGSTFLTPEINGNCDFRHGTQVAHVAAAHSDNGVGVAGIVNADIFAARVFDCGRAGSSTDIADAIRWMSAGNVSGVDSLDAPVDVINMSLSGEGSCPGHLQSAINLARSRGVVVVNAAGNDGDDTAKYFPATCDGVITVGANRLSGMKTWFSNDGDEVDIFAMGENVHVMYEDNTYGYASGTSFSSPIVAAHATLIKAVEPEADHQRVIRLLQSTANPFVTNDQEVRPGRLESLKLALAITGESYVAGPLSHVLMHEDRSNTKAYTQPGTGLNVCTLYEVDTRKLDVERPEGQYFKVFAVPKGQDFTVSNGTEIARSQGSRVLIKTFDPDQYDYGLASCNDDNSVCQSSIPVNLDGKRALTRAFCP